MMECKLGLSLWRWQSGITSGIIAECGGACATCHVYVDEVWVHKLPPDGDERGMRKFVNDSRGTSRLSRQIRMPKHLDGLGVTTPADQG